MFVVSGSDFTGKVAVITGGGGVICSEFAKALAARGTKVALLNRTEIKAQAISDTICAGGGRAIAVRADVCDKESVRNAHKIVLETYGACDILINGAGGNRPDATVDEEYFSMETFQDSCKKSFFDLEISAFSDVIDLNFLGTVITTQEFAQDMIKKPGGVIINISSMNAFNPLTKIPAYSAAKSAVSNFTKWLAVHFANRGIRVNAIAPGFFASEQNRTLLYDDTGVPTARTGKILAATPMGRLGNPEELIGTLIWLADDRASGFVTGITVPVDGGFSAYSGV